MAEPLISFTGSEITINGDVFKGEVAVKLKDNMARHVRKLAVDGVKLVREGIKTKNGTGFTSRAVGFYQKPANSLYAKVRMRPDIERYPASARYPANRRAYIVNAVLESGRYARKQQTDIVLGPRGARQRSRTTLGTARQEPLLMWKNAATKLRAQADDIRENELLRGLK